MQHANDESAPNKQTYGDAQRASQRKAQLKARYGITVQQYEAMFLAQGGVCKICSKPCKSRRFLSVDHDHETGQVRGLLCLKCNMAIGQLDSAERCRAAADYLKQAEQQAVTSASRHVGWIARPTGAWLSPPWWSR